MAELADFAPPMKIVSESKIVSGNCLGDVKIVSESKIVSGNCLGDVKIVSESKIDLGNCVSKVVPVLQILWIVVSVLETCF